MTAHRLESVTIQCPYCWENFEAIIDCSFDSQEYIEDCEICCRPIVFDIQVNDDGLPQVSVVADNT